MDNNRVRKLLIELERLCHNSLGHSSFTNAEAAETMRQTLSRWLDSDWARIALLAAIPPPSFVERSMVTRTFEARARILRIVGARYRVTFFSLKQRCVVVRHFENPLEACEFAATQSLHGLEPAPVDVVEPALKQLG